MRGMPKVCLKAFEIIEVDDGDVVGGVRRGRFVAGAVQEPPPDAHVTHRWDLANRAFERRDERLPLGRSQIGAWFDEDDVSNHRHYL